MALPSATMPVRRVLAGSGVLLACIQYPICEAIAAAAWHEPAYSFARNYISDLGVVTCSATVCSPRAAVMNAAFVASGVLAIAAVLLLAPLLCDRFWRRMLIGCTLVHGIGTIVVGLVHSAPGSAGGTPGLHYFAACGAILGGNFALFSAGRSAALARAPRWFAATLAGLGVVGLCGALALVATDILPTGLAERLAADTITPGELLTGAVLLAATLRPRPLGNASMPRVEKQA